MAGISQTGQGREPRGRRVTGVRLATEAEEREEAKSLSTGRKDSGSFLFLDLLLESTRDGVASNNRNLLS